MLRASPSMSMHPSAAMEPSSPAERRSGVVFTSFLLLVLLAVAFPELAPQALLGILWAGTGGLMLALPPERRLPRSWWWLALGFITLAAAGFLPREWFHLTPWRLDLETLGLPTGPHAFVQPTLAAETWTGFAVTAATALFLLGHRVSTRWHHRLALAFALGIGLWTVAAMWTYQPNGVFGFFPNRNHAATLLVMGMFVGLGSLVQAIRQRAWVKLGLSVLPVGICLWALFTVSESRAGIVLAGAGLVAWILLTGVRQFQGHAGKAVALVLIGGCGAFLIVESKVKTRLAATVERIEAATGEPPAVVPAAAPAESSAVKAPRIAFDEEAIHQPDLNLDGRVSIFRDTWEMIGHEPWCGVGPGQFAQVFPQYRRQTTAPNDARCIHPESDWLMMVAEAGWPATVCLAGGVLVVMITVARRAWRGRARLLRMGCLVAVLVVVAHGIFDVPGHRIGLAWAAILLTAISLRPSADQDATLMPSRTSRLVWRGLGLGILLGGAGLLAAQWTGTPVLPSVQVRSHMEEAKALYDADQTAYDRAKAEGHDYQPSKAQDPLEAALARVDQAIRTAPLDPHLHYTRGALALHFDDKSAIATQAFAIQRRLLPCQVNVSLEQAQAWMIQDPQQTKALWADALRRAAAEDARTPKSPWGVLPTYQQVLQTSGKNEPLATAAMELADATPELLMFWARTAPAGLLDREMPRILPLQAGSKDRDSLLRVWKNRGTKAAVGDFTRSHPEFEVAPP